MSASCKNGSEIQGHEIQGECPVYRPKNGEKMTVEELASLGMFNPSASRCIFCSRNSRYRRCIAIFNNDMSPDATKRVREIIKNSHGGIPVGIIECHSRISAQL